MNCKQKKVIKVVPPSHCYLYHAINHIQFASFVNIDSFFYITSTHAHVFIRTNSINKDISTFIEWLNNLHCSFLYEFMPTFSWYWWPLAQRVINLKRTLFSNSASRDNSYQVLIRNGCVWVLNKVSDVFVPFDTMLMLRRSMLNQYFCT